MTAAGLLNRVAGESLMLVLRSELVSTRPLRRLDRVLGRNPIPRQARSWYIGILGEQAVAQKLRSLPEGWVVLRSVPVGSAGSDIDHVVISPSGRVLTLNTKHSPGAKVWVSPRAFLVNGRSRPYLRNSQHEAARAAKILSAATGGRVETLAVIVVVAGSLTHKGEPSDVAVVTEKRLVSFLTRRLSDARGDVTVEAIRHAASQPATWVRQNALADTPQDTVKWFEELKARVNVARGRRVLWASVVTLMAASAPLGVSTLVG